MSFIIYPPNGPIDVDSPQVKQGSYDKMMSNVSCNPWAYCPNCNRQEDTCPNCKLQHNPNNKKEE